MNCYIYLDIVILTSIIADLNYNGIWGLLQLKAITLEN